MMPERDDKASLIIETAQKRFGLYGVEKTSMREIADDLKLSKASLYYYFPDKESLYRAVVVKEQKEFISRITENTEKIEEPDRLLIEYVDARLSYFRSLLNLTRLRMESYSALKPAIRETLISFREYEKDMLMQIFKKGTESGMFFIDDPEKTAYLFLDILKGLRISVFHDKINMVIEDPEFEILRSNTLLFTNIFIKGLTKK